MLLKDTGRWNRLKAIFERAAEIEDPILADAFLKAECGGDTELLEEARRLIELHHEDGLALDGSPVVGMTNFGQILGGRVWEAGQLLAGERFRIVRFLGEGGVGEVYEAEDLELKQHLAIKTLHPLRASEESTRERFKREIQLARRISHPHVCRIFDFYPGEIPFITMELLEGELLSDRIQREGHLSGGEALPIARELCSGLAAAHAQNIVHRDLKPSNIMLCDGRAVIMDFGLALLDEHHDADGATAPTSALGTPAYMSPEQLEGRRVTPASDIYSLGVVLYAMLTGTTPHAGLSPLAIAARRVQEAPPSPRAVNPEVSERWDQAVRGCLNVDPAKRIESAEAIIEAIGGGVKRQWRVPAWMVALVVLAGLGWWLLSRGVFMAHQPTEEAQRWVRMGDDAMALESSYAASRLYAKAAGADPKFALARIRLAEAEMQQDRYERAKDHLLEADLVLGRAPSTVVTELQAAKAASVRDFPVAVRLYKELVQTAADRPGALLTLSGIQARSGDRNGALASVEEATKLNPQLAAGWLRAAILSKSNESFRKAQELFDLQRNIEGLIEVYRNRALAMARSQHLREGREEIQRALQLAESIQSPSAEAQVRFAMSRISALGGEGDDAILEAITARNIASNAQLEELSIRGTLDIANAWTSQYRLEDMETILRKAAEQAESIRAFVLLAQVRFALAQTMSRLRRETQQVEALLLQAQDFFQTNHMTVEFYEVASWLVLLDTAKPRYDAGRTRAEEIMAWFRRSGEPLKALIAEENIAEIEDRTASFPAALDRYHRLAERYLEQGLNGKAAYALANGASAAIHFGDLPEARLRIASARAVMRNMNVTRSSWAIWVDLVDADLALAERRYQDAERLVRPIPERNRGGSAGREVLANGILAVCLSVTGRAADGVNLAQSNLKIARDDGQPYVVGQAWLRLVQALMYARRFNQAAAVADDLIPWLADRQHRSEQIEALALRASARQERFPEFPQVWSKPELLRFLARPNITQLTKGRIK